MAEKAKKSTKDNKSTLIGCIAAAVAVVVIIIVVVLAINNNSLSDSYFVSDNTKYVLTIDTEGSDSEDQYAPLKTHLVYTYDGDKITSMKTYYVYADDGSAKTAFEALKEAVGESEEASSMELNGKYIIITSSEESYKDLTASEVKKQIDLMETLKNVDSNSSDDSSTEETEEVEGVEVKDAE